MITDEMIDADALEAANQAVAKATGMPRGMIDEAVVNAAIRAYVAAVAPQHASDCAVHNAPALPVGPCDCALVGTAEVWQPRIGDAGVTAAARDVLAERKRQVEAEGWSPEHDDEHDKGEMAGAAACYALVGASYTPPCEPVRFHAVAEAAASVRQSGELNTLREVVKRLSAGKPPSRWPWSPEWWKPKDRRQNLVRAGALILAEIERLDRAMTSPAALTPSGRGGQHE